MRYRCPYCGRYTKVGHVDCQINDFNRNGKQTKGGLVKA